MKLKVYNLHHIDYHHSILLYKGNLTIRTSGNMTTSFKYYPPSDKFLVYL